MNSHKDTITYYTVIRFLSLETTQMHFACIRQRYQPAIWRLELAMVSDPTWRGYTSSQVHPISRKQALTNYKLYSTAILAQYIYMRAEIRRPIWYEIIAVDMFGKCTASLAVSPN